MSNCKLSKLIQCSAAPSDHWLRTRFWQHREYSCQHTRATRRLRKCSWCEVQFIIDNIPLYTGAVSQGSMKIKYKLETKNRTNIRRLTFIVSVSWIFCCRGERDLDCFFNSMRQRSISYNLETMPRRLTAQVVEWRWPHTHTQTALLLLLSSHLCSPSATLICYTDTGFIYSFMKKYDKTIQYLFIVKIKSHMSRFPFTLSKDWWE